jgi:hypothetical protein
MTLPAANSFACAAMRFAWDQQPLCSWDGGRGTHFVRELKIFRDTGILYPLRSPKCAVYRAKGRLCPNKRSNMRGPIITAHCAVRARQRGYRHTDFEMVESTGIWMREGIFVRRRDVDSQLHRLSAQLRRKRREGIEGNDDREIIRDIERLQRLPGTFIPVDGGHALSIYRPSKRRLKRILRGGRMRGASRRYAR